jgi:zeta-carotene desaturase
VRLFESRPFLGGRAASFPISPSEENSEMIDNCQHVLLRCCVNLLDFYRRLGVEDLIQFDREFHFIEPGGRVSTLRRGSIGAPLHLAGSFLRAPFLGWSDKLAVARGLAAIRRERTRRTDLDRITMLDWLLQKRQTPRAIERFWRPVLVSAVNEELDHMAAAHGFQVFWLGFLAGADGYEMGVPSAPLGELYRADRWPSVGDVSIRLRAPVERIDECGVASGGAIHQADAYICALPFERLPGVGLPAPPLKHSPIAGIHLWFDRKVTDLPHATLLDRTIQWMFNKSEGRYLLLVVSAARDLMAMRRADVIAIARGELAEFLPAARRANLERAHLVKELRATFSGEPDAAALRPGPKTGRPNLFLAGDWTRSGWPATMEGAVRSGYQAAEAVAAYCGRPQRFLLPDIA